IQILLAPDTFEPGIKCGQVVEIQRDEPTANVSGDERQATLWVDKPLFHKGFGRQFLLVSLPAGQCWLLCSVRTNGQDAHATLERGQRHLVRWRLAGWHNPLRYSHAHPSQLDNEPWYVAARQWTYHKPAGMYLFSPPDEAGTGARNGVTSRFWRSSSAWAASPIAAKRGRVSATVIRS